MRLWVSRTPLRACLKKKSGILGKLRRAYRIQIAEVFHKELVQKDLVLALVPLKRLDEVSAVDILKMRGGVVRQATGARESPSDIHFVQREIGLHAVRQQRLAPCKLFCDAREVRKASQRLLKRAFQLLVRGKKVRLFYAFLRPFLPPPAAVWATGRPIGSAPHKRSRAAPGANATHLVIDKGLHNVVALGNFRHVQQRLLQPLVEHALALGRLALVQQAGNALRLDAAVLMQAVRTRRRSEQKKKRGGGREEEASQFALHKRKGRPPPFLRALLPGRWERCSGHGLLPRRGGGAGES